MLRTRLTALLFLLLITTGVFAQILYEERFDSDPGLPIIDNDGYVNSSNSTETWVWSSVGRHWANAVVTCGNYAMRSITSPFPAVNGQQSDDWIKLPQITNLPANAQIVFEFCAESQRYTYEGHPELDVVVSTTDTQLPSYSTIKTVTVSNSYLKLESADLSAFAGQDIHIAIVNRCYNPPGWGWKKIFLDNIQVGVFQDHDLQGFTFISDNWGKTGQPVILRGSFVNRGMLTMTSMDYHYRVNGGQVVTGSVTGQNMAMHDTIHIDHPTPWTPSAQGTYTVELWADNLDGNPDGDGSNDTLVRIYEVYDKVTKKLPLLEVFSGADCGACAPLAADIDPFIQAWDFNAASGHLSSIEYQTYNTDPSDNADAQTRDTYYSVSGYPDEQISDVFGYRDMLFDRWLKTVYPFFDVSHSIASALPAFIDMTLDVWVNGNTVNVTVDAMPLKDFTGNAVLHIAVCEHEYTYTGGATSQTVFKHVMRKMLPDGDGTALGTLSDNVPVNVTEGYTFTIGNVTEGSFNLWVGMNNIEVVAFIQNPTTDEVYQSVALHADDLTKAIEVTEEISLLKVFPSPASDVLFVQSSDSRPIHSMEVTAVSGQQLMLDHSYGQVNNRLDIGHLPGGFYFLSAYGEQGELIGNRKFVVNR